MIPSLAGNAELQSRATMPCTGMHAWVNSSLLQDCRFGVTSYLGLQPQTMVPLVWDCELKEYFPLRALGFPPWHFITSSFSLNWQYGRKKTSALSLSKYRDVVSYFIPSFFREEASTETRGHCTNKPYPEKLSCTVFQNCYRRYTTMQR